MQTARRAVGRGRLGSSESEVTRVPHASACVDGGGRLGRAGGGVSSARSHRLRVSARRSRPRPRGARTGSGSRPGPPFHPWWRTPPARPRVTAAMTVAVSASSPSAFPPGPACGTRTALPIALGGCSRHPRPDAGAGRGKAQRRAPWPRPGSQLEAAFSSRKALTAENGNLWFIRHTAFGRGDNSC